jgi:hypothetical protein
LKEGIHKINVINWNMKNDYAYPLLPYKWPSTIFSDRDGRASSSGRWLIIIASFEIFWVWLSFDVEFVMGWRLNEKFLFRFCGVSYSMLIQMYHDSRHSFLWDILGIVEGEQQLAVERDWSVGNFVVRTGAFSGCPSFFMTRSISAESKFRVSFAVFAERTYRIPCDFPERLADWQTMISKALPLLQSPSNFLP